MLTIKKKNPNALKHTKSESFLAPLPDGSPPRVGWGLIKHSSGNTSREAKVLRQQIRDWSITLFINIFNHENRAERRRALPLRAHVLVSVCNHRGSSGTPKQTIACFSWLPGEGLGALRPFQALPTVLPPPSHPQLPGSGVQGTYH